VPGPRDSVERVRPRRSSLHLVRGTFAGDASEQRDVVREVRGVDQCETAGALVRTGDDEACDLDELTMATGGCSGVLTSRFEVMLGGAGVSFDARQNGEQCVIDRVHAERVRLRAYSTLTDG
jgi:hypothetical protein